MELKIKGLQAQLRTFKEREEEREREQAEPWALRLKNAPAESPSAASVGGLFVAAGGGQVVEFLPSAASMQEECCKMCESCGTRDTLWLIAFSFDRREVVESLSPRAEFKGPTHCWFWTGSRRSKVLRNSSRSRSKRQP